MPKKNKTAYHTSCHQAIDDAFNVVDSVLAVLFEQVWHQAATLFTFELHAVDVDAFRFPKPQEHLVAHSSAEGFFVVRKHVVIAVR